MELTEHPPGRPGGCFLFNAKTGVGRDGALRSPPVVKPVGTSCDPLGAQTVQRCSRPPLLQAWVTNRSQSAVELWRDYNGRACIEQRIEELKHDLAADGFCLQPFFAPDAPYRQPGTLRVAVFLCGAVLGVMGHDVVVKLSEAWGGLSKHKPLVDANLNWLNCTSPKLIPPEDRQAIGGVMV
jgi:hypothetical protein